MSSDRQHTLIDLLTIQPVVHFAERAVAEPGFVWGPRTIPDCQLLYVLHGRLQVELGAELHRVPPGTCIFYGENSPHRITAISPEPAVLYSVHFAWNGVSPEPVHPAPGILSCPPDELALLPHEYRVVHGGHAPIALAHRLQAPELEPLFRPIVEEFREQADGYETALRGYLAALLVGFLRRQRQERPDPGIRRIAPALDAIAREQARNWSSRDLAQLCGYHPAYFAEIFKEATGLSPKAYIVQKRIGRAKQLLLTGERITDIAESLGYDNVHYFSRNFREATGLSPSEYRLRPGP